MDHRPGPSGGKVLSGVSDPARRRGWVTAAIWLIVAVFAVWAGLWLFPSDVAFGWVQLVAFTPYVALSSPVALVLALLARRWVAGGAALVVCLVFAVIVGPRMVGESPSGGGGPRLRVLAVNLLAGGAPAEEVVRLVRELRVDVVAFQELTPSAVEEMGRAGVDSLLPHRVTEARPGTRGSGIYSRFPATRVGLLDFGGFGQLMGLLNVDGVKVEIVSVHPCAPYTGRLHRCWGDGLDALPRPGGAAKILIGDFNATVDHARVRDLLDSGYRDAAEATGEGLLTTWPALPRDFHGLPIPPVTIDHVLADDRTAFHAFSVHLLSDTDHKAVFADLELPGLQ
ncbi:endonuclease/exonuclease/phosphatase family protein [Herbidospora sp. NEAU-GS84]|uniref:Endonuclease/exonuclease/phosphatase family protein n=1 Tax=Herbidospora solisilvae TaxID=2696284 RepID=A0A7C9MZM6_9ACTN|nr:endonuclease/exonuclease/phosphatase family protein [Herbidospora solisilvae]NAS21409.1 endonuclease/exonuclease/phosphatase family protein [Herbidospora solisilvae]